jgi:hypothetical protein
MPNDAVRLAGREFVVSNREEAMCIAGEGELPFAFGAGYPAPLVDLRARRGRAASPASITRKRRRWFSSASPCPLPASASPICAARRPQTRRRGQGPQLPALRQRHQHPRQGGAERSLPLLPDGAGTRQRSLRILHKAAAATRIEPLIPLGSVGRFGGQDWTVIGFQERAVTVDGQGLPWQEYLLHHPKRAFAGWSRPTGHWSWVSPVANPPRYQVGQAAAIYKARSTAALPRARP